MAGASGDGRRRRREGERRGMIYLTASRWRKRVGASSRNNSRNRDISNWLSSLMAQLVSRIVCSMSACQREELAQSRRMKGARTRGVGNVLATASAAGSQHRRNNDSEAQGDSEANWVALDLKLRVARNRGHKLIAANVCLIAVSARGMILIQFNSTNFIGLVGGVETEHFGVGAVNLFDACE
eukprot:764699-Hanusia_phi.AAC.3